MHACIGGTFSAVGLLFSDSLNHSSRFLKHRSIYMNALSHFPRLNFSEQKKSRYLVRKHLNLSLLYLPRDVIQTYLVTSIRLFVCLLYISNYSHIYDIIAMYINIPLLSPLPWFKVVFLFLLSSRHPLTIVVSPTSPQLDCSKNSLSFSTHTHFIHNTHSLNLLFYYI